MFRVGDRVRIIGGPWASDCGIITKISRRTLSVRTDTPRRRDALVNIDHAELIEKTAEPETYDFDGGFGIGGLGSYVELPIIPTEAQIERMEKLERRARRCRRCGQSDVFDGAMFTVNADICDDCF
jgi:hypothetical protein